MRIDVLNKLIKVSNEYNAKIDNKYSSKYSNVDHEDQVINLKDLFLINPPTPSSVVAQMARTPADYAYWGMVRATLEEELKELEYEYKQWRAGKYLDICAVLDKKATESMKDASITATYGTEQKHYESKITVLNYAVKKAKIITKAFEMKADMLRSVGAIVRQELDSIDLSEATMTSKHDGGVLGNKSVIMRKL